MVNVVDLMVYAVAKDRDMPLLFTGCNFASIDVRVHGVSRVEA